MFITAIFLTVKRWKNKCAPTDEWTNTVYHTMIYLTIIKKTKYLSTLKKMSLDNIMLQGARRQKVNIFHYFKKIQNRENHRDIKIIATNWGASWAKGMTINGYRICTG